MIFNALIVSVVPCLVLMVLIYRLDRYDPERISHLVIAWVLGILVFFPARNVEMGGVYLVDLLVGARPGEDLLEAILDAFLVFGTVEEVFKLLVVAGLVLQRRFIDEPVDCLVYGWTVALGFAALENFLYVQEHGSEAFLLRALLATPAHALFSGLWAWGLGHALFGGRRRTRWIVFAAMVVQSIVVHGIYDAVIEASPSVWWVVPILVGLLAVNAVYYRLHIQASPHRFSIMPTGIRTMRKEMVGFAWKQWIGWIWFAGLVGLCVGVILGAAAGTRWVFEATQGTEALVRVQVCGFEDRAVLRSWAAGLMLACTPAYVIAGLAWGRFAAHRKVTAIVVPGFVALLAMSIAIGIQPEAVGMWLKGFASGPLKPCNFKEIAYTSFALTSFLVFGLGCLGGWLGHRLAGRGRATESPSAEDEKTTRASGTTP